MRGREALGAITRCPTSLPPAARRVSRVEVALGPRRLSASAGWLVCITAVAGPGCLPGLRWGHRITGVCWVGPRAGISGFCLGSPHGSVCALAAEPGRSAGGARGGPA